MKNIAKQGSGGYQLTRANANPPTTAETARGRWGSFSPHKATVMNSLLSEQFKLCCYSELRADRDGIGYHIEHVEPKSANPKRTFDYSNLTASALDSETDLAAFAASGHEVFGGHAKKSKYDKKRFISPLQADCARFFFYLSDGRVVPREGLRASEKDRAEYTIDLLNLNSPYLVERRKQWWDELDELFEEHVQKNWELSHLAATDLVPVRNELSPFFSMTRQFFGAVAEAVLLERAPQLV